MQKIAGAGKLGRTARKSERQRGTCNLRPKRTPNLLSEPQLLAEPRNQPTGAHRNSPAPIYGLVPTVAQARQEAPQRQLGWKLIPALPLEPFFFSAVAAAVPSWVPQFANLATMEGGCGDLSLPAGRMLNVASYLAFHAPHRQMSHHMLHYAVCRCLLFHRDPGGTELAGGVGNKQARKITVGSRANAGWDSWGYAG